MSRTPSRDLKPPTGRDELRLVAKVGLAFLAIGLTGNLLHWLVVPNPTPEPTREEWNRAVQQTIREGLDR